MKNTLRFITLTLTLCTLSGVVIPGVTNAGDVIVITHPSVDIEQLSKDDVMRIFLAKSKTYPNEKPAIPVIPKEGSSTRQRFESSVFAKTPMQVKAYWTRLLFTGRGNPPLTLESDEAIKKKVAETPNAIGYIDSASLDDSVRVVFTIQ